MAGDIGFVCKNRRGVFFFLALLSFNLIFGVFEEYRRI